MDSLTFLGAPLSPALESGPVWLPVVVAPFYSLLRSMYSTAKLVFEWDVNPFDRMGSDSRGPLASSVLGVRESDDFVYE